MQCAVLMLKAEFQEGYRQKKQEAYLFRGHPLLGAKTKSKTSINYCLGFGSEISVCLPGCLIYWVRGQRQFMEHIVPLAAISAANPTKNLLYCMHSTFHVFVWLLRLQVLLLLLQEVLLLLLPRCQCSFASLGNVIKPAICNFKQKAGRDAQRYGEGK